MAENISVFDCDGHIIESIPEMVPFLDPIDTVIDGVRQMCGRAAGFAAADQTVTFSALGGTFTQNIQVAGLQQGGKIMGMPGGTLEDLVAKSGPLPGLVAVCVLDEVLRGIAEGLSELRRPATPAA